jgi:hypothetical protein
MGLRGPKNKAMKRKVDENIEHRGNTQNVTSKLWLEMQLIRNMNQNEPVYSFEEKEKSEEKK